MRLFLNRQFWLKPKFLGTYYPTLKHGVIIFYNCRTKNILSDTINPLRRPLGQWSIPHKKVRGFNPLSK